MLTGLRQLLRSKASALLFALIIVSMGVWGITDIFSGSLGQNMAQGGGRGFTVQDFDYRVEQYIRNQRNEGKIVTREQVVNDGVVDQLFAVESGRTINLGYASQIGALASTKAVSEDVREIEAFRDPLTGRFGLETYRDVLGNNGLTPQRFEADLRDGRTLDYIFDASGAALQAPLAYRRLQAGYLAEGREVEWITLSLADIGEARPPTGEEVAAFYAANQQRFTVPERRRIGLLRLSPRDFSHRIEVSEEDLRAIYETQKTELFSAPGTRRFVEMVVRNEASARDVLGRLAAGIRPSEISSPDVLGTSERVALRSQLSDEAMAAELFSPYAQPGTVAGPFRQEEGWRVVRLEEIRPGDVYPFDQVRADIVEEYVGNEADARFMNAEMQLFDFIGSGLTLSDISDQLETPVMRYLPLTQAGISEDGKRIGQLSQERELMQVAFSLETGEVSDPIETETELVMVEVDEILPPLTRPLEEIEATVRAVLVAERETERLMDYARSVETRIRAGELTLADAAGEAGVELQTVLQPLSRARNNDQLPAALQAQVFELDEGDLLVAPAGGPGQVTVLKLTKVQAADEVEIGVLSGVVASQLEASIENDLLAALEMEFREATGFQADAGALAAYKASITEQP